MKRKKKALMFTEGKRILANWEDNIFPRSKIKPRLTKIVKRRKK